MFDKFSDNAKRLMSRARQQALDLRHGCIAPEHLLLGILDLPKCTASAILQQLGVATEALRDALLAAVPAGVDQVVGGSLPFTPSAKDVLERMLREVHLLGVDGIGSEHALMALTVVPDTAAQVALERQGVVPHRVRDLIRAGLPPPDPEALRLLLISNSTMHGGEYLGHAATEIRDFLGPRKRVMFVPFALHDHDGYAAKARAAFGAFGHDLVSAHEVPELPSVLPHFEAVFVGGGNTFRLLKALRDRELLEPLRRRVLAGMPYVGSSAGTNVATPSICTTNDMPIVMPPSFGALGLVPFQINPHYLDPDPTSKHMGETREERIRQFHEEDDVPVLGLREGCMLRVEGTRMELRGTTGARLFRRAKAPAEFVPPCDLSFLLAGRPA